MKEFHFVVLLDESMEGKIDLIIDNVFSELDICDAFYGNILNVSHHFFNLVRRKQYGETVYFDIRSDFQFLYFRLGGLNMKYFSRLQKRLEDTEFGFEYNDIVFLIRSLTDGFSFEENALEYVFNIQALSPAVFNKREYALKNYFSKLKNTEKAYLND